MIDLSKKYNTVSDNKVELFTVKDNKVFGIINYKNGSVKPASWYFDGSHVEGDQHLNLKDITLLGEQTSKISSIKYFGRDILGHTEYRYISLSAIGNITLHKGNPNQIGLGWHYNQYDLNIGHFNFKGDWTQSVEEIKFYD
jgi:hypothetical protein